MKIITILGARPQFIKASVVSAAMAASNHLVETVVHTGQHFDENMSNVFFSELGMEIPAYNLDIQGGNHGEMTGRMLIEIEKVLLTEEPDMVLVYGDTNSTLAGALAGAKLHINVAHVEAGLRSFNMNMPEEINRILTDRVSKWLFTPTSTAAKHLRNEGIETEKIIPVGDVMYDVALHHGSRVSAEGRVLGQLAAKGVQPNDYCLATIHRAENTDHPARLNAIVKALSTFSQDMPVIWPLHPRTRNILAQQGKLEGVAQQLILIDPVGYLAMVQLEKYAAVIATDSGGVQKEAFFHQVPCVTLRDETEWVELVEAGWNRVASPDLAEDILPTLRAGVGSKGRAAMPYGDGKAAQKIVSALS